tara:strand:- start:2546 stop:2839 length:294 start_codon:yes stop_codon:yes gene_type:complete
MTEDVKRITDPFVDDILETLNIQRPHLVLYAAQYARVNKISPSLAIEHIRQGLVSIGDIENDIVEDVRKQLKKRQADDEQHVILVETAPIVEDPRSD